MKDIFRRIINKYNQYLGRVRQYLSPEIKGKKGWLVKNYLKVNNEDVEFTYRVKSAADKGVIDQVFHCRDYSFSHWKQGQSLGKFYDFHFKKNAQFLIIDAGANIGASTVYFSKAFPNSKIVSVEPEKNNCAMFIRNCGKLDVELIEGAIGREQGLMYLQDPGRSDWGFQIGKEGEYEVKVVTIEQIILNNDKNIIPFILKIDIEGGEDDLFSGDCNWIKLFPLIIVELHDWMNPGKCTSRNFYQSISNFDFDILQKGENTFCFNNKLLRSKY